MNIFSLFTLAGGLALFLYGMMVMSSGLEKVAGGRMEKCGAVLAAEYVLSKRFPDSADSKCAAFEKEFTDMNCSLMCRELKGALTGAPLRSCRGCVTDAAEILERMCSED